MRYIKYFLLMVLTFALASCATTTPIDYGAISSNIQSGKSGGVIAGYKASSSRVLGFKAERLDAATVNITNLDEGTTSSIRFSASPTVQEVKPGNYKINSGRVRGPNTTGNMPLISLWAGEFTVTPGKIVNLGELAMNRIETNVQTDGVGKAFNIIGSFGTDLNDNQTYVTYEVNSMDEKVQAKALKNFPGIVGLVEYRPLKMRLSESEFRKAVYEAAVPTSDGELPTKRDVNRKLSKSLLMMLKSAKADMNSTNLK